MANPTPKNWYFDSGHGVPCIMPYKCHTYLKSLWSLLFLYKSTWCYVHQSWRKLSFKPKTWFFNFSDGKWYISKKCSKLGQIIPKQAYQWLIFQLDTMPSHCKINKGRLTVQTKSLLSRELSWWRKTAKKFAEK